VNDSKQPWWRGAALYQIYPLSFADSNGDGWGDLPGVTAKLDYVASLGVDGIWLSPFYESAFADFGYDTTNQKAVDPRLGTLADFDALLRRAHALGLKVLVDQIYTYTSDRHDWFRESRAARGNPRDDWYVWADARPDGTPPNNWMSIFGGPAWEWDRRRRQYYMTHFLPDMPHLRVQNPAVQEALLDIGRFWLDRGVDGFRLDVINLCMVDHALRDNPRADPAAEAVAMPAHAQQSLYDSSLPESYDFVRRIRGLTDERPGRFLLGEIAGRAPLQDAQHYCAGNDLLHSAYYVLGADTRPITAATLRDELSGWNDKQDSWPTWSFSNHDVVRGPSRCGSGGETTPEFAKLLIAVLATARGTMLLYQGDELGLPDGKVPQDSLRDPATKRFFPDYLQRDGSRTPMPWRRSAEHAGFTTGVPWLPLGDSHSMLAADQQEESKESTLTWTRRLLALRHAEEALRVGSCRFLDLPEPLLGFERVAARRRIRCVFNISSLPTALSGSMNANEQVLLAHPVELSPEDKSVLRPFGFVLTASDQP
jgi:alpha-glucosidase